jgi:histidine triad (HIT) family protein
MDESCIFCRIIAGEIPAEKICEDDEMLAIKDVNPAAPQHALLFPKKHFPDITATDARTIACLLEKIPAIAERLGIKESGFRVVINAGEDGGQTVRHTHVHLLGGRSLKWPPG